MVVQAPKETPQEIMSAMEAIMVNEFRVCQSLLTLLQQERQALVQKDVETLSHLVEQKESLLDELGVMKNHGGHRWRSWHKTTDFKTKSWG